MTTMQPPRCQGRSSIRLASKRQASNPYVGLDRPFWLQEVEASRISRQSAHEGGNVSPTHRPSLPATRRYSWHPFLLVAETTAGSQSIKNSNYPSVIVRPACSAVPKPNAPSRTPLSELHAQTVFIVGLIFIVPTCRLRCLSNMHYSS